jgi:hypothetical protein
MDTLSVKAGATITIGAPANPLPSNTIDSIARVLASHHEVTEAHLPQVFIRDAMQESAQVLVLFVKSGSDIPYIVRAIADDISRVIPKDEQLDIWPISPDDDIATVIRKAGCLIFGGKHARPWWAFWKGAA